MSDEQAHHLEQSPIPTARAFAPWGRAACAHLCVDEPAARQHLARAAELFDAADATACAASARYWLGGSERDLALEVVKREGVVRPEHFARMVLPGFGAVYAA